MPLALRKGESQSPTGLIGDRGMKSGVLGELKKFLSLGL